MLKIYEELMDIYSKEDILWGIKNPREGLRQFVLREYSRLRLLLGLHDTPVFEKDWDNLLLLDGCRYDLFESTSQLPGDLKPHYSNASNTALWVRRNIQGKEFPETVCVTSTPKYTSNNVDSNFHDIIKVWEDDWDEELRTIPAEVMNEHVLQAAQKYPNKRILAHYIPPHIPFIGPTGQDLPHKIVFSGDIIQHGMDEPDIWETLQEGGFKKDDVWKAYRENLEMALGPVENALEELSGKTVITSDHGNGFGEWGVYGHPSNRHIEPLVKVPWHVYQNGKRKEITKGDGVVEMEESDEGVVNERLKDLGYK